MYIMKLTKKKKIIASPFIIIILNFLVAYCFGKLIGKWSFIPIILIEWCVFLFLIIKYTDKETRSIWLQKPKKSFGWNLLAIFVGILPLPLFLMHYHTLEDWKVWFPWIIIALINPCIEEFYWRGLLMKYTKNWHKWLSIIFTSFMFSINHAVFGINSELNSGFTIIISTFIMGIIWAFVYVKTDSLKWIIISHFLVDLFNLSTASFLDLY